MGHEFRQRCQCGRSGHAAFAGQGRRALRQQAAAYGARHGLSAGKPRCARCGATARLSDEGVHLDAPGVDVRPVRGADRVGLCGAAAWIVESVVAAADAQRTGIAPLTAGSVADLNALAPDDGPDA
ncbi:hypothetical protein G6F35_015795 [Rhizopus arrhizus]|nr:hypothetical protein G6F35_015795 [Rhizopus arrhizus]